MAPNFIIVMDDSPTQLRGPSCKKSGKMYVYSKGHYISQNAFFPILKISTCPEVHLMQININDCTHKPMLEN